MDPRDWTLDLGGKAVRQFDHKTHVGRLDEVLVSWVAVAKMYAQLDRGWHAIASRMIASISSSFDQLFATAGTSRMPSISTATSHWIARSS